MSCTLVTAFYPIKSKAPTEQYIEWAITFLKLKANLILFTTSEMKELFMRLRENRPIHLIELPFESLYTWEKYKDKWIQHYEIDPEKFRHSPELYTIWAEKAFFVKRAIELNPYNTEYFFWCDIGAFRDKNVPLEILNSFPTTKYLPKNRIALCSVNKLEKEDTVLQPDGIIGNFLTKDRIVGGLWGGDISGCLNWCEAYENMLVKYFEKNRFAGKDQSVMLSTYLKNKNLAVVIEPTSFKVSTFFFFEYLHSNLNIIYKLDSSYLNILEYPLVSVIIPTYNRFSYLLNAIESVKKQTYDNIEIIVVNDCSTQSEYYTNTLEGCTVINLSKNTRQMFGHPCVGFVRNRGLKIAKGKYVAFLDDDDIFLPDKILRQVRALNYFKKFKMSSTEGLIGSGVYDKNKKYPLYFKVNYGKSIPRILDRKNIEQTNLLICSSVMIEREFLNSINGFKNLPISEYEDYELWLRCLKKTKCVYIDTPLMYYDSGHGSGQNH